jgi:hypothetical protein
MPTPPPLHFGPYASPPCRKGAWIVDEIHGLVEVNGWTDGPLGWPTRKRPKGGPRSIAVTADLVRAIQTESAVAVAYWFGISTRKVRELRRALDVARNTVGTLRQHAAVAELPPPDASARGRAKVASDSTIRARIAAKQRGKVISAEARQKMSEAGKGRRKPPGWGERASQWLQEGRRRKQRVPQE